MLASRFRVIPPGFEPGTYGLEGRCSIQLSYETMCKSVCKDRNLNLKFHNEIIILIQEEKVSLHDKKFLHCGEVIWKSYTFFI